MQPEKHATHNEAVLDQFTKQAIPFASLPAHSNESAFRLLLDSVQPTATDTVLDVACGPGLVACALAPHVSHVTGIDLTPAMVDLARSSQQEKGLTNMTWEVGDVMSLPYPAASFSLVITRFTFHHFLDPLTVLREMVRVCTPGGTIAVIDVVVEPEKADAYNEMERLRDPSHVKALTRAEFDALREAAGLSELRVEYYKLEMELERQLQASFPNPGDADRLRKLFHDDLEKDALGVGVHRRGDDLHFAYPIGIHVWGKDRES